MRKEEVVAAYSSTSSPDLISRGSAMSARSSTSKAAQPTEAGARGSPFLESEAEQASVRVEPDDPFQVDSERRRTALQTARRAGSASPTLTSRATASIELCGFCHSGLSQFVRGAADDEAG